MKSNVNALLWQNNNCTTFSNRACKCQKKIIDYTYRSTYRSCKILEINPLRTRQNECHFANDVSKWIFLNENYEFRLNFQWSLFLRAQSTILLHWFKCSLVWCRRDDKPLSGPLTIILVTHVCVTRSQWVEARTKFDFRLSQGISVCI